jgi:hypothetical protein
MAQEQELLFQRATRSRKPIQAVRVVVIQSGRLIRPRRRVVASTANLLASELLKEEGLGSETDLAGDAG